MIELIEQEVQNVKCLIEQAPRSSQYTLALQVGDTKRYVLSKYKPREDSIRMLGNEWGNKSTVWILFGFGFGYMLGEIVEKVGEQANIIIIEPNQELLRQQMEVCETKELLELKNIKCISGQDIENIKKVLDVFIPDTEFNNINIRYIEKYIEYYSKCFGTVLEQVKHLKNSMEINFNTQIRNEVTCVKNTIMNRKSLQKSCDLSLHQNKYKDIPALIVAAGPSLSKNIEQIRHFKGLIFVVGRTMTPIIEQGIKPDFVFMVDPFDLIYETFDKHKEHDIPLVALANANSKVVKGSKGPKYFIGNDILTSNVLGVQVNPNLDMYASVSTLCISTATYMGCNPIVFVGQDLAYTENKLHSELALMEEGKELNEIGDSTQVPKIKGYYGDIVTSGKVWISVIKWIEQFIETKNKDIENKITYINATEGGAYIEGAEHLSLRETIEHYCSKQKPEIKHELIEDNQNIDTEEALRDAVKALRNIHRGVILGEKYYKELIYEYGENKELDIQKIACIISKIQRVDAIIMSIKNCEAIVQILMNRIKIAVATSNNSKQPINEQENEYRLRACRLNHETYEQLVIESEGLIRLIKEGLKEDEMCY